MSKNKVDLTLDQELKELRDILGKAQKVFAMGSAKHSVNYVIKALQNAIDVAQGKSASALGANKEFVQPAQPLSSESNAFHNKFAKMRAEAAEADSADNVNNDPSASNSRPSQ
jgi:hypothetical protein